MGLAVPVHAVARDVLRDDDELLDAGIGELPCLGENMLHRAGAVFAAQLGDDAEGAPVVAALRDAQEGVVTWRGEHAAELVARRVDVVEAADGAARHDGLDRVHNVLVAAGAENAVHLRKFLCHLTLIALRHAAGDQNFLELAGLFQLRHGENVLDGLLIRAREEAAGVDHRSVAALGQRAKLHAGIAAQGHHLLAVDHIFRAAERNKVKFVCHSPLPVRRAPAAKIVFGHSPSSASVNAAPAVRRAVLTSPHEKPRRSRASDKRL